MASLQLSARGHSSGANATGAFGSSCTSGSTIIVCVCAMSRTTSTVPTDTLGNTYVLDRAYTETNYGTWSTAVYRATCGSSGPNTVTISRASSDSIDFIADERDDLTASPFDKYSETNGTNWGNSPDTSASTGTLSQADEVVYALATGRCTPGTFTALPAPSGFTTLGTNYLGSGTYTTPPAGIARQVVSSTSALAPVWSPTMSGSNDWAYLSSLLVVTYKVSGGGGGSNIKPWPNQMQGGMRNLTGGMQ